MDDVGRSVVVDLMLCLWFEDTRFMGAETKFAGTPAGFESRDRLESLPEDIIQKTATAREGWKRAHLRRTLGALEILYENRHGTLLLVLVGHDRQQSQ